MTIDKMLEEIRKIIAKCPAGEREVYEALSSEAEGWDMRLQELDQQEKDE